MEWTWENKAIGIISVIALFTITLVVISALACFDLIAASCIHWGAPTAVWLAIVTIISMLVFGIFDFRELNQTKRGP